MEQNKAAKLPEISFGKAVIAIVVLIAILFLGFAILDVDTKVVFTVASVAIGIILVCFGFKMTQVFQWFIDGAKGAMDVILILMAVGTVIGTWIISGTIPTIIYYGLSFLTPSTFMMSGFALCCIVSVYLTERKQATSCFLLLLRFLLRRSLPRRSFLLRRKRILRRKIRLLRMMRVCWSWNR